MNSNTHELIYKEEVFKVVGCAMEVLNTLGGELLEKLYGNSSAVGSWADFQLQASNARVGENRFMRVFRVHSCQFVVLL